MAESSKPFHNPFGALAGLKVSLPSSPGMDGDAGAVPSGASPQTETAPEPTGKGPARAVVRLERAGRRGKEVTVIEHLELSGADLERWLKAMKAGLGCGGVVEGRNLVLQGDHRDRVPKLLTAQGVRKVTVGT